jgi:hypothetical protein
MKKKPTKIVESVMKQYPTPLGKKTYDEYAKELKEFNLSAEPKLKKVEFAMKDYDTFLSRIAEEDKVAKRDAKKVLQLAKDMQAFYTNVRKASFNASGIGKNADKQFEKDFKIARDLGLDLSPLQKKRREIQKAVSDVEKAAEIMQSKVKI